MGLAGWITIATILLIVAALMSNRIPPDMAMLGGLTILMVAGVVPPAEAVSGFAQRAVVMIGAVYVIAAGLTETGATDVIVRRLLGRPRSLTAAQLRMMVPVAVMSAFMNTTAVVAMYIPLIHAWSRRLKLSPSKLFIPLSYAAILGGTCTLIGTSSNITITGLYSAYLGSHPAMVAEHGLSEAAFWWVSIVGVPSTLIGILYLSGVSRWLLPERKGASAETLAERQYKVEMLVEAGSPVIGQNISEAGLRHLPGLYLVEIEREGNVLSAVGPLERIQQGDHLVFVGIVESVRDLSRIKGLVPSTASGELSRQHAKNTLVEAVVSPASPLIGRTVRGSRFRTTYSAAVIAVHRSGHFIEAKIGDIRLQPGDTLLLETQSAFVEAYRNSSDFYLISEVPDARAVRHDRTWLALGILGLFVFLLVFTGLDRMVSALVCAGLMVLTRCCRGSVARKSINWQVLIVIGAAIGIGRSMEITGVAAWIAGGILDLAESFGPHGVLVAVYLLTSLFAQLVSNNGAAVLMFPVAMSLAHTMGLSPIPFLVCLMSAAACSFMTPIAYQTNLMVYGPGGYRFLDYTRIGLPLTLAVCAVATWLAPLFFPFIP